MRRLIVCGTMIAAVLCLPAGAAAEFAPAPGSPMRVGAEPFWVAAADFDGDGHVDLASANSDSGRSAGSVTVLLGRPGGELAEEAGSPIDVGARPDAVAIADFNADGRPDMAVSNFLDDTVTILLRRAGGGLVEEVGSPVAAGPAPHSVLAGDFNGDRRPDLALPDYGGGITLLLRQAGGGFVEEDGSPFATGSGPTQLAAADFDADGRLDLAAANFASDDVSILLRQAAGGFTELPASPFAAGDGPYGLVAADLDGDGRTDLAATNEHSDDVTILLGGAGGGFAAAPFSPLPTGRGPLQLAAADLDGDHRTDLAVPNHDDGTVTVLLQHRAAAPVSIGGPGPVVTLTPVPPGVTVAEAPINLQPPGIVERTGGVLLCNPGSWTNVPARPVLAYEWIIATDFRRNAPATTEVVSTEAVLVQRPALIGREIACRVTAYNVGGQTSATSASWLLAKTRPIELGMVYGDFRIRGIDVFQTVQPNSGATMYEVPTGSFAAIAGGGTPTSANVGLDRQRTGYLGVPIDAGKPATAVVYVDHPGPVSSPGELELSLTARRNGRQVGTTQYASVTRPRRTSTAFVTSFERDTAAYGWQFRIPLQWLEEAANGHIELEAKIALPASAGRHGVRECALGQYCGADNAYRLTGVEAIRLQPLNFRAVELLGAGQPVGSLATPEQVLARTRQLFPGGEGFQVPATYAAAVDVAWAQALPGDDVICRLMKLGVRECRSAWVQATLARWQTDHPAVTRLARDRTGRTSVSRRVLKVQAQPLRIVTLGYASRVGLSRRTVSVRVRTSGRASLRVGGRRYAVGAVGRRIAVRLPARPAAGLLHVPFTLSAANRTVRGTLEILRLEETS